MQVYLFKSAALGQMVIVYPAELCISFPFSHPCLRQIQFSGWLDYPNRLRDIVYTNMLFIKFR
jgi:hypothetical protein